MIFGTELEEGQNFGQTPDRGISLAGVLWVLQGGETSELDQGGEQDESGDQQLVREVKAAVKAGELAKDAVRVGGKRAAVEVADAPKSATKTSKRLRK